MTLEPDGGFLPDPGPGRPDAPVSNATTYLTFERAELEETVRWIARTKKAKKGASVPRKVSLALHAFSHMLNAYPDAQTFHISAPDEAGQPLGLTQSSSLQVNVTL